MDGFYKKYDFYIEKMPRAPDNNFISITSIITLIHIYEDIKNRNNTF